MSNNGKGAKIETELGFKVETTQTYKDAEHLAKLKEEIEDKQESLKRGLEDILEQMRMDHIERITVKAPGGSLFTLQVQGKEIAVKIKKANKPEQPLVAA